jgi:hypothetical protein
MGGWVPVVPVPACLLLDDEAMAPPGEV